MNNNKKKLSSIVSSEIDQLVQSAQDDITDGYTDNALSTLNKILTDDPTHSFALWNRALIQIKNDEMNPALEDLYLLLNEKPKDLEILNQIRFIHRKLVGSWHFDMMNDTERNEAFLNAINNIVTPTKTVLDIGTGSGLLSMMAARAGAKHVYSCEKELPIRLAAEQIIQTNGFSEKITIIDQWSTNISIPDDIPEKVDVIVGEILGSGLLEEEAIHYFQDAKKHLLKPGGIIIPRSATMFCSLFESEEISKHAVVNTVCGFDLSQFNSLHYDPALQLNFSHYPHKLLSNSTQLKSIDFLSDDVEHAPATITITATSNGICHGAVQWFQLFTDESNVIDTSPMKARTHWDQHVQIFQKPITLIKGESISFTVHQYWDRFTIIPQEVSKDRAAAQSTNHKPLNEIQLV